MVGAGAASAGGGSGEGARVDGALLDGALLDGALMEVVPMDVALGGLDGAEGAASKRSIALCPALKPISQICRTGRPASREWLHSAFHTKRVFAPMYPLAKMPF